MNPEELKAAFPGLKQWEWDLIAVEPGWFTKDGKPYVLMQFGFSCDKGWEPILRAVLMMAKHYRDDWDEAKKLVVEWEAEGGNATKSEGYKMRKKQLDEHPENPYAPENFKVAQCKEKFGMLRFYADGGDKRIHEVIRMAETLSGLVCMRCGLPGKLRGRDAGLMWVLTLCDKHYEDEKDEKKKQARS